MSFVCVKMKDKFVWWYDANNICLEFWQKLMIGFGVGYALPFPVTLLLSMKLLQLGRINSVMFIICNIIPIFGLFVIAFCLMMKSQPDQEHRDTDTSLMLLSVLQGPYRKDKRNIVQNWEAMISLQRLLITALTLLNYPSVRMLIISCMFLLFLGSQVYLSPFKVPSSNQVETMSLFLLAVVALFNLMKALLTEVGVVPSGPSVIFFKGLEFMEKMFVLILILVILIVETRRKIKTTAKV